MPMTTHLSALALTLFFSQSAYAQAVPGYVPPVTQTRAADYADDTRGVFVPNHTQFRLKDETELHNTHGQYLLAQANTGMHQDDFEREMNRISGAGSNIDAELNRIAGQDGGAAQAAPSHHNSSIADGRYGQPTAPAPAMGTYQQHTPGYTAMQGGGVEVAIGQVAERPAVDMQNSLVRVREERITVRRVVQRMMDQIGASDWTILWDLSEQNMPLAEMEISIDAHEPFLNVLNALLARLQTRSGHPLRVIRYDNTKRLVITDRSNGHSYAGSSEERVSPIGVGAEKDPVITENVLKEAMISLHYDEIPLVDALESIVNQAGKGQWRLRIYAGVDQVLKPAHIEEPFSIAMERLLRLFNLKYEIFPGGKLVVVTQSNRFGFNGGQ